MIAFTDAQLTTIQIIAAPLPLQFRSEFLKALATELCGCEPADDQTLHDAALRARHRVSRAEHLIR